MMRVAGRNYDLGTAKAVNVGEFGDIKISPYTSYKRLAGGDLGDLTIPANSQTDFYIDNFSVVNLIGVVPSISPSKDISIGFQDGIGSSSLNIKLEKVEVDNTFIKSHEHVCKSHRTRIRVKNNSPEELIIIDLFAINSVVKDTSRSIDIIEQYTYTHSDFFNYNSYGDVVSIKSTKIKNFDLSMYKDILLYIDSSYEVPFDVNCYESTNGVYRIADFDGENFIATISNNLNYTQIPKNTSSGTIRYPIHNAITLFGGRIKNLQVRVRPAEIQTRKKHENGNEYVFNVMLMGVRL